MAAQAFSARAHRLWSSARRAEALSSMAARRADSWMRSVAELIGRRHEFAHAMRRERLLGYPCTLYSLCRVLAWACPWLSSVAAATQRLADLVGARAQEALRAAAEAEQRQQALATCMQHLQHMAIETPLTRLVGEAADEEVATTTGLASVAFLDAPPELRDALRHAAARAASARAMARLACVSRTLNDAAAAVVPSQNGVAAAAVRHGACEQARQMHKIVHVILVAHDTAPLDELITNILVSRFCDTASASKPPAPWRSSRFYTGDATHGHNPATPPAAVWRQLFKRVESRVTAVQERHSRIAVAEELNTWYNFNVSALYKALLGPASTGGGGG